MKQLLILTLLLVNLPSWAQLWQTKETSLAGSSNALFGNNHAWADIDRDGDPDLFVNGTFWLNRVNEVTPSFEARPDLYTPANSEWSPAFGDFNNDGYPDLHIAKGSNGANAMLENRWPNAFFNAAAELDYLDTEFCQPAFWADYNNDGLLDLYVTHEFPGDAHEFWKNNYPIDFEPKFPAAPGLEEDVFGLADLNSHAYGSSWADIDLDGDIDAVTSACGSNNGGGVDGENPHNKVYRNDTINLVGPPKDGFTDITQSIGVVDGLEVANGSNAYWCTLFDANNDGLPDLFIGDNSGHHRLWRNTTTNVGEPQFQLMDVVALGLDANVPGDRGFGAYGHSAVAGDWDNDGFLDLYLTNQGLYRNDGDGTFTLTDHVPKTSSSFKDASFVDYDNDGDLDVFNQLDLWENPGNGNHWISIELEGDPSMGTTRSAHHVRIRVTAGDLVQTREHRYMVGTYTQHMLPTHFGLAAHTLIDEIAVFWPDGTTTTMTNVAVDQQLTIAQSNACRGTLQAVSPTTVQQCPGQDIPLQVSALNGIETVTWTVISGPDMDSNQFDTTSGDQVVFTPSSYGSYEVQAIFDGCEHTSITFVLENDFYTVLPTWASADLTHDTNSDQQIDIFDLINCVAPMR